MSIIRRKRENNYTIVPNTIMEDDRMSFEARGLLTYILTRPDHWKVHVNHLKKVTGYGRDKCQRLIREILECGYGRRELEQDDKGQFTGQELVFYDEVYMEAPEPENQLDGTVSLKTRQPDNPVNGKSGPIVSTERQVRTEEYTSLRRGSRLREDWEPNEKGIEIAAQCGIDVGETLPIFRDYWVSVPGQKGVKLDWDATWRNWCRNEKKRRAKPKSGNQKMLDAFAEMGSLGG